MGEGEGAAASARVPKPIKNSERQIPSPFMG